MKKSKKLFTTIRIERDYRINGDKFCWYFDWFRNEYEANKFLLNVLATECLNPNFQIELVDHSMQSVRMNT